MVIEMEREFITGNIFKNTEDIYLNVDGISRCISAHN